MTPLPRYSQWRNKPPVPMTTTPNRCRCRREADKLAPIFLNVKCSRLSAAKYVGLSPAAMRNQELGRTVVLESVVQPGNNRGKANAERYHRQEVMASSAPTSRS